MTLKTWLIIQALVILCPAAALWWFMGPSTACVGILVIGVVIQHVRPPTRHVLIQKIFALGAIAPICVGIFIAAMDPNVKCNIFGTAGLASLIVVATISSSFVVLLVSPLPRRFNTELTDP